MNFRDKMYFLFGKIVVKYPIFNIQILSNSFGVDSVYCMLGANVDCGKIKPSTSEDEMDLIDRIKDLASRIPKQVEHIQTEEATKNAFIMPFINALGYDIMKTLCGIKKLNNELAAKIFSAFIILVFYSGSSISEQLDLLALDKSELDSSAYKTALALNYTHASLYTIVAYQDRIVLDQEYKKIISNINLSQIEDKEIIDLLQGLMDALTTYLLNDEERSMIQKKYEERVKREVYKAFTNSISNFKKVKTVNPAGLAAVFVGSIGDASNDYMNSMDVYKEELDEGIWELKKDQIKQLNVVRKQFLMYYWKLMKKYDIPDKWRITEERFKHLIEILTDDDLARKYRRLEKVSTQYEAYPVFLYYYGKTAHDLKLFEEAKAIYERYIENNPKYFRNDYIYANVLLNHLQLLNIAKDKDLIYQELTKALKVNPNDNYTALACAIYLQVLGKHKEAIVLHQHNIDEGFMVDVSTRMLGENYLNDQTGKFVDEYLNIVSDMLSDEKYRMQDVFYLIAQASGKEKEAEVQLLEQFSKALGLMKIEYHDGLINNTISFTIPIRWIINSDGSLTLVPYISYLEGDEFPEDSEIDMETLQAKYTYENFLDFSDFPGKKMPFEVVLNIPASDYPIKIVVKYYKKESEIITADKVYLSDDVKNYVPNGIAEYLQGGTEKVEEPYFYVNSFVTADGCYRMENNNLIAGCD
jgi:tetratricopeptide (TPR) repeat protein